MMADLWNALKQRCEDVYRRERRSLSFFDLTNEITELRHQCPEWEAIPAITAHRVAKHLVDSYKAFYRRLKAGESPGYPRWQSRARAMSIPLGTMAKTGWTLKQRTDNPLSWALHYGGISIVRDPKTWIHARGAISPIVRDWRNADILWRDNRWWLSICVEAEPRRMPGRREIHVTLDLVDTFATVNGIDVDLPELDAAGRLQDIADTKQADRDLRWPRGKRRNDEEQQDFVEVSQEISRLRARAARKRANALHVWTARLVESASGITIVAPAVRANTQSPRGTEKSWGAQIETASTINRNTLNQAPATAVQLIVYKAEEAGIRCDIVEDRAPVIGVVRDLVSAGKELRRARRINRKAA